MAGSAVGTHGSRGGYATRRKVARKGSIHTSKNALGGCRVTYRLPIKARYKTARGTRAVPVIAFRESDEITDWRIQDMVKVCHTYFCDLWSKGNMDLCDELFAPGFVHQDNIWRKSKLDVGPMAMKQFVGMMRTAYPDFHVEIVELATSSETKLFVEWTASCTNLGRFHGKEPTRHFSNISGVSTFTFNHNRSKIEEVSVFREPTAEEKMELAEASDPMELHLVRLHFG